MNKALEIFDLAAIFHGCFSVGVSIFIIYHYTVPKYRKIRWHIIGIVLSYMLLTCATLVTAKRGVYRWGDGWFWCVIIAYLLGDICWLILLRIKIKKDNV